MSRAVLFPRVRRLEKQQEDDLVVDLRVKL